MKEKHNTETSKKYYASINDVQEIIGCGHSTASDIVRAMNKELAEMGKWTVAGKVPWPYLRDRLGIELDYGEVANNGHKADVLA